VQRLPARLRLACVSSHSDRYRFSPHVPHGGTCSGHGSRKSPTRQATGPARSNAPSHHMICIRRTLRTSLQLPSTGVIYDAFHIPLIRYHGKTHAAPVLTFRGFPALSAGYQCAHLKVVPSDSSAYRAKPWQSHEAMHVEGSPETCRRPKNNL
jgi:hypothetical protein